MPERVIAALLAALSAAVFAIEGAHRWWLCHRRGHDWRSLTWLDLEKCSRCPAQR